MSLIIVVLGVSGSGKTTVGTLLAEARLKRRHGHFMKADMLESQFAALEEPTDAIVADVAAPPGAIVQQIVERLGVRLDQ